jgi:hypothetical protein
MNKPPGPREQQLREQREAKYEAEQKRQRAERTAQPKPPQKTKPWKGKK